MCSRAGCKKLVHDTRSLITTWKIERRDDVGRVNGIFLTSERARFDTDRYGIDVAFAFYRKDIATEQIRPPACVRGESEL